MELTTKTVTRVAAVFALAVLRLAVELSGRWILDRDEYSVRIGLIAG